MYPLKKYSPDKIEFVIFKMSIWKWSSGRTFSEQLPIKIGMVLVITSYELVMIVAQWLGSLNKKNGYPLEKKIKKSLRSYTIKFYLKIEWTSINTSVKVSNN